MTGIPLRAGARHLPLLVGLVALACASGPQAGRDGLRSLDPSPGTARLAEASTPDSAQGGERKIVRNGQITLAVPDLAPALAEVERLVAEVGGLVEHQHRGDTNAVVQCRVPAAQLEAVLDRLAALGEERDRSISASDVTDQYADLETRLRNDVALRDRLRALLERATRVEDVLAIERELNRVQSSVESLQGRLDRLSSQIELAPLSITLERKRVLGPLGYVAYGLWWAASKLFVLR